jgi:hypothetical protein
MWASFERIAILDQFSKMTDCAANSHGAEILRIAAAEILKR